MKNTKERMTHLCHQTALDITVQQVHLDGGINQHLPQCIRYRETHSPKFFKVSTALSTRKEVSVHQLELKQYT